MTITLDAQCLDILAKTTSIDTLEAWTSIFFLISKSEHDNEDYDKTFISAHGGSVFTYAEALRYDYKQRGVTCGLVGFTTANSGKASWGDAQPMFRIFHELGGPDLRPMASACRKDKSKADALCARIRSMNKAEHDTFMAAQVQALCCQGGYVFETAQALGSLHIPPSSLLFSAVLDTMLNFGIGGKWCPKKWLQKKGVEGNQEKTLKMFLRWKKKASSENHHNSCKHNAVCRTEMFSKLLREKQWSLCRDACEKVVKWTMK